MFVPRTLAISIINHESDRSKSVSYPGEAHKKPKNWIEIGLG
jgi:hypothetical protein